MRYLSILFLGFLMWWSWSAMEAPAVIPDYTHADVQDDLKRVIEESILEDVPAAADIRFEKMWTQTLRDNEMKASFSYSYDDASDESKGARIGVDGYALLRRVTGDAASATPDADVWNVEELYFLNNRVNFKEGVTVRAQGSDADPANQ